MTPDQIKKIAKECGLGFNTDNSHILQTKLQAFAQAIQSSECDEVDTNVVSLSMYTKVDLEPDKVLKNLHGKLTGFVLSGYDLEGEYFFSSTYSDAKNGLWLMEQFKQCLLKAAGENNEH